MVQEFCLLLGRQLRCNYSLFKFEVINKTQRMQYNRTWQNNNIGETYTGVTKNFKTRYGAHKGSFTHEGQNKSTLSRFIWDNLKGPTNLHKLPYNIKWDIVKRGSLFNPLTGVCRLCNWEKFFILFRPEGASLNQRSEFFSYCKHKEPQLLKLVKI